MPVTNLLGNEGEGFRQVMDGIEVGRVNVAARAVGLATRAFEEAIRYAQERHAFGRPIAATRAGGIPEVVGDCGLLVPIEDPNALGEAIVRLIQDSSLAARLRAGSRERAAEFSVERMADRTIVVYERVLANGR